MEHHRDLLSAAYWRDIQEKIETSGVLPFSPYARASRARA
jgi:isocitrate dehydrogenase kinase/phosphatase